MIQNETKNFVIIKKAKICKNVFCKAFGFMFRFKKPDKALVFIFKSERRADLHMLFVFFPIDVLFLDKNKKVVDIKKDFKPFSYYAPRVKAEFVVEVPVGRIKNTKLGDGIVF
ncbi:DUF192 domain-containing protein [Candidatus Woesearchaeota archaeon]|nr:DUF192 domain-containing protein [Candidatus Woesearchaeota archaeon]